MTHELRVDLHEAIAKQKFHVSLWGDEVAEREGYDVDGYDAVAVYLFRTHGLMPGYVEILRTETVLLMLSKEMKDWTVPAKFRDMDAILSRRASIHAARYELYMAEASIACEAEIYGDRIAERENYKTKEGREALEHYVCVKLGYRPDEARAWSLGVFHDLLAEEMAIVE